MRIVFVLHHGHAETAKLIGIYHSREGAEAAIARLTNVPGFRDDFAGFAIDEYRLDQDHWSEGFISVAQ